MIVSAPEIRLFAGVPRAEITALFEEVEDENRERRHRQLVPVRQLALVSRQVEEGRKLVIVEVLRCDCAILGGAVIWSESPDMEITCAKLLVYLLAKTKGEPLMTCSDIFPILPFKLSQRSIPTSVLKSVTSITLTSMCMLSF